MLTSTKQCYTAGRSKMLAWQIMWHAILVLHRFYADMALSHADTWVWYDLCMWPYMALWLFCGAWDFEREWTLKFWVYVGPYLIDDFVQYLNGRRQYKNEGYVLVSVFFCFKTCGMHAQRHWFFRLQLLELGSDQSWLQWSMIKVWLFHASQSRATLVGRSSISWQ